MNYGYIRISTKFQNVERQERNIRLMCPDPNLVIIKEIFTGSTQDRPKWRRYYPRFMPGDNIYFDSVSRMARDEDDGVKEYLVLEPGGIDHSESSRNNQSELIRNSQCTCLAN